MVSTTSLTLGTLLCNNSMGEGDTLKEREVDKEARVFDFSFLSLFLVAFLEGLFFLFFSAV